MLRLRLAIGSIAFYVDYEWHNDTNNKAFYLQKRILKVHPENKHDLCDV